MEITPSIVKQNFHLENICYFVNESRGFSGLLTTPRSKGEAVSAFGTTIRGLLFQDVHWLPYHLNPQTSFYAGFLTREEKSPV